MKTKILLLGSDGYVGSRVYDYLNEKNIDVVGVDIGWFGIVNNDVIKKDYNSLTPSFFQDFSHIICLAGHSSVSMCENNTLSCIKNNINNFISLLEKIDKNTKLIYASTLAIYGNNTNIVTEKDKVPMPSDIYDYSLMTREFITSLYDRNTVGLRFGTIGGFSKNLRKENLINSISMDAIENGKITISNPNVYRSVLGMNDLCNGIYSMITSRNFKNKIYNISSINDTVINFGKKIQEITGCELTINDTFKTKYNFRSTSKLFSNDYNFIFKDTIESIFTDIKNNIENIKYRNSREKVNYD
jgi:nucleoside-diphosphate-sugar epimerase